MTVPNASHVHAATSLRTSESNEEWAWEIYMLPLAKRNVENAQNKLITNHTSNINRTSFKKIVRKKNIFP
jgi:hypothetical protein